MIEVLPTGIARGIQLVGLEVIEGRRLPVCALLAFRSREHGDAVQFHFVWLDAQPSGPFPPQAFRDLILDALPELPPHPASRAQWRGCPVCGQVAPEKLLTADGRPVCRHHLVDLWNQRALEAIEGSLTVPCPACSNPTPLFWNQGERLRCTGCLASELLGRESPSQWILMGWKPAPMELLGDLHIFLEAWKRVSRCQRCGSVEIRIRKVLLDFPRAAGPLYPLWELGPSDRTQEGEKRRSRQLDAFTRGLMRVTLECPQCGYLEREMPGLKLDHAAKPYPAETSLPILP